MRRAATLAFLLLGCSATDEGAPAVSVAPVNTTCPRSGEPVAAHSLTEYRGYVVGFCNQHCRDDFEAHGDERPRDTAFFDAAIAELEAGPTLD